MRALITGANGDIGQALLYYLLENNYSILAMDVNINRLIPMQDLYDNLEIVQLDFCDNDAVYAYLDRLKDPYDVVICAAGIREITPAIELTLAKWRDVFNVNLVSAFLVSQCAAKLSIQQTKKLCMIYISSISGLYGEPGRSAYCASKHGLIGLAKSQAIEWAPHAIRVNVIAPGIIESELTRPYKLDPYLMNLLNANIPLMRWGQPHHVVQTVDMIIKNDYMTGSTVVVDGGWTAGKKL